MPKWSVANGRLVDFPKFGAPARPPEKKEKLFCELTEMYVHGYDLARNANEIIFDPGKIGTT